MNTNVKYIVMAAIVVFTMANCKSDKKGELLKLKKQQQELTEKIAALEAQTIDTTATSASVQVTTETVAPMLFTHAIEVQGALDGEQNVKVFPQAMGTVTQVMVSVGSNVLKGQVIAKIDDQVMRKTLAQTTAQYKLAAEMFQRQQSLWEQKIGSEMQYLQAKTQYEALENGLAALKEQLDFYQIKSPISGTVEDLPLKIGASVSPQMPVATVINFSTMKVVADVAEAYNMNISAGDAVELWFPDLNREVSSKITSASKLINPQNRSFRVEVSIPGSQKNLKVNMIAVLRIIDYKNPKAIAAKVNLIQSDAEGDYLFVVASEKGKQIARKRYIKQGLIYTGMVEIKEGLTAGEIIVSMGQFGLTDGAEVTI